MISTPLSLPPITIPPPPCLPGFNLRDELAEVKALMDGEQEPGQKSHALHRRYQSMAREYKRLERKLADCQKKQLEVCHASTCLPACLPACLSMCKPPACSEALPPSLPS